MNNASRHRRRAFTLIELLVVISIIALLVAILLPVLGRARKSAEQLVEIAACRSILQAYTMHNDERRGRLLEANLAERPVDVRDSLGNLYPAGSFQSERWPWHLAAYLDYAMAGSLHVNEGEWWLTDEARAQAGSASSWAYLISLNTSFGMNGYYVGGLGNYDDGNIRFGPYPNPVTRDHQVVDPSRMIVFASAGQDPSPIRVGPAGDAPIPTYYFIAPPDKAFDQTSPLARAGFVHLRLSGQAATAHFDGHADLKGPDELIDRTRWSNEAAKANDPDWSP